MPAYKPYLKLRSRRKAQRNMTLDGEYFFSEHVADSPCEAAFYIVPHKSEPMFKVGWAVAADRRLDQINEIWGGQLDIYSALVIATSRDAAQHAERTMKLILNHQGWRVDGLPPLEGWSEFFSVDGLLHAYDACMNRLLPTMCDMDGQTHVIMARGLDEPISEMFQRIVKGYSGKLVSPDRLLAAMVEAKLLRTDIPKVIGAMSWSVFPNSIINILVEGCRFKNGVYAPYVDDLWMKFGEEMLVQSVHLFEMFSKYRILSQERNIIDLLGFMVAHNVVIKNQANEWIFGVIENLSAGAAVELIVSQNIELRKLTFVQRAKIYEKILRDKDGEGLFNQISHGLDDVDQLKAEAADRLELSQNLNRVDIFLINPNFIEQDRAPKNFPGVLARIYYDYFDGLVGSKIIGSPHWLTHEQMHFKTFNMALDGLRGCVNKRGNLFDPVPVFYKAVLVAMLDLYDSFFEGDKAHNINIEERLASIGHGWLAQYFDKNRSSIFALIRDELRRVYDCILIIKNNGVCESDAAVIRASIKQLEIHLSGTEEGVCYAMYAFQDMIWELGDLIVSPCNQDEEERRLIAIQYVADLWSLVREKIIANNYAFNRLLLYLNAWADKFKLNGVPAAHPQAVL